MIKVIKWLLGLCNHEYTMFRESVLKYQHNNDACIGTRFYYKCSKCDKIKKKDIIW